MNKLAVSLQYEQDEDGPVLLAVVKVDGQPLTDFGYYNLAADLVQLQKSTKGDGEFFIITCVCGVPLCAGIKKGILVTHQDQRVIWVYREPRPDPKTEPELVKRTPSGRPEWVVRGVKRPTRTYVFDREEYISAFSAGIKRGKQFIQQLGKQHIQHIIPAHNRILFRD